MGDPNRERAWHAKPLQENCMMDCREMGLSKREWAGHGPAPTKKLHGGLNRKLGFLRKVFFAGFAALREAISFPHTTNAGKRHAGRGLARRHN